MENRGFSEHHPRGRSSGYSYERGYNEKEQYPVDQQEYDPYWQGQSYSDSRRTRGNKYEPDTTGRRVWKWLGIFGALFILIMGCVPAFYASEQYLSSHEDPSVKESMFRGMLGMDQEIGEAFLLGHILIGVIVIAVLLIVLFQGINHSMLSLIGGIPLFLLFSIMLFSVCYLAPQNEKTAGVYPGIGLWGMMLGTILCLIAAFAAKRKKVRDDIADQFSYYE